MTAEQILADAHHAGIVLEADGDKIRYQAPTGVMTPEWIERIRQHKPRLMDLLMATQHSNGRADIVPGDCEACPAGGYWDWKGPGLWCFHYAYYLGKSGRPTLCAIQRNNCPLGTPRTVRSNQK